MNSNNNNNNAIGSAHQSASWTVLDPEINLNDKSYRDVARKETHTFFARADTSHTTTTDRFEIQPTQDRKDFFSRKQALIRLRFLANTITRGKTPPVVHHHPLLFFSSLPCPLPPSSYLSREPAHTQDVTLIFCRPANPHHGTVSRITPPSQPSVPGPILTTRCSPLRHGITARRVHVVAACPAGPTA